MISIIVPTVQGREAHLDRCLDAYQHRTSEDYELIVVHDKPTCGLAWNEGAAEAHGDFLHFSADDLEPHEHWDEEAIEACVHGCYPAPRIFRPEGPLESAGGVWGADQRDWAQTGNTSVVPFMSQEQWERIGPSLDCHYYTDNWLTDRARTAGYPVVVRSRYRFTHHWAQPGRGAGMTESERMAHDRAIYEEAVRAASDPEGRGLAGRS